MIKNLLNIDKHWKLRAFPVKYTEPRGDVPIIVEIEEAALLALSL